MNIPTPQEDEDDRKLRVLFVVIAICVALGVFTGGVVSGYFYFRAEQRVINAERDAEISQINHKLDSLLQDIKILK